MRICIFGCPVTVSPLFFSLLALLLLIDRTGMMPFVLLAVCLHESGHLLAMGRCEIRPIFIELLPFEINIQKPVLEGNLRDELVIALAGVAANFLAVAVSFGLWITFSKVWMLRLLICNLALGVFQSLPIEGLDGYRALGDLLYRFFGDSSGTILKGVSYVTLGALTTLAALVLMKFQNPFLLLFCLYCGLLMPLKERR